MMQYRNQEQLFLWIEMVGFMLVDLCEYLDTHPCDQEAIDLYHQYHGLYQKALEEYAAQYSPLTLSTAMPDNKWSWGLSKNPWERGYV
jgi:spore coat protein JB